MNIADDIKRLHELHLAGALTDAEFAQAKARLLSSLGEGASASYSAGNTFSGVDDSLTQLNRFRRSKNDRWFGGICGGLGKFTGMESWLWRLLFVFFTCYFGAGLVAYVLAWIFVPEEE